MKTKALRRRVSASRDPGSHFIYIVRCSDGTLYTGYARHPERRVAVHNAGRGAKYTAGRRPVTLVYWESCRSQGAALKREYQVKQLARADKERLLARGNVNLTNPSHSPNADELSKSGPGERATPRQPRAPRGRSVSPDASRSRFGARARAR